MKIDQQRLDDKQKRPYHAPELKSFGSLQRMTQTAEPDMVMLDFAMLAYVESM